jgi:hypothetical protein
MKPYPTPLKVGLSRMGFTGLTDEQLEAIHGDCDIDGDGGIR